MSFWFVEIDVTSSVSEYDLVRVVVGGKGLKEGNAEVKLRTDKEPSKIPLGEAVEYVQKLIAQHK